MKSNIKRVAAALCSCTLLAAGLTACGSTDAESVMDSTVAVQVQNVRRGSIELQGTYVGSVSAAESVNVIPLVQGATVESVNVAVGSEVKQGQVLAKLDSTSADLTAKNAQAAYNSALAQAQSALGGQWKTNIYSAERGIDQLDDSIDNMNDSIDDFKNGTAYKMAKNARNDAKAIYDTLRDQTSSYKSIQSLAVRITEQNKDLLAAMQVSGNVGDTAEVKGDGADYVNSLAEIANLGEAESGMDSTARKNVLAMKQFVDNGGVLESLTDAKVDAAKAGYDQAQIAFDQVDSQLSQLETQRDSLKAQKETA